MRVVTGGTTREPKIASASSLFSANSKGVFASLRRFVLVCVENPIISRFAVCSLGAYADGMDRKNWLLLALNAAGAQGLTPAQLQKSLFLLGRELPNHVDNFYHFTPYNYGPFSKQIYDDAEAMSLQGLLTISQVPGRQYSEYAVSPRGRASALAAKQLADRSALEYLERVVDWASQQSFSKLVRSIYRKYPEFRVNSVFQD